MLLGAHLLQRLSACHRAKVHLSLRKNNVSLIPTFTLPFLWHLSLVCVFAPHPIPTCLFSAIQVCSIVRGEDYKRGSAPSRLPHLVQDLPNRIVELPQGVPIVRGSIVEISQDFVEERTCCSIREIQARSTTVRGWSQEPNRGNMATSHLSSR